MAKRKNKTNFSWSNNSAYLIGIIASDGNLSSDLRHINITSKDVEMIENCKKILNTTNKIGKKGRGQSLEDKKYYVLQFSDKSFFEFLLNIGLIPNKSKTLGNIKIPEKYFKHFFRGCIDGDGNINISKHPESKHPQYKIRIYSASYKFLDFLFEKCKKLIKINGGHIHKPKKSSTYTLSFGKGDCIKILNWIYEKDVVCLSRKREIAYKIMLGWRNW